MYADNPHRLNGENMAKYLPFRGNHSIVEAQANLLFPGQFDRQAVVAALGVAQAELRVDLPRSAEVRGGSMQIDISNPEASIANWHDVIRLGWVPTLQRAK